MGKSNAVETEGALPGESSPGESQHNKLEELVQIGDIKEIDGMNKDELNVYSITRFGKDLKLSEKVKLLKLQVINMVKERLDKGKPPSEEKKSSDNGSSDKPNGNPEFIFNPANRRVFEWTENLATREDLIPCWLVDKKGKKL